MVRAVARSLGWTGGKVPLALAGSFLLGSADVRRGLVGELARVGFELDGALTPIPVPDPVAGALVLARRELERSAR